MIIFSLNFIGFILISLSLIIWIKTKWKKGHRQSFYIMVFLLITVDFVLFSNVLEHSENFLPIYLVIDYLEVLIPVFFAIFIFLYLEEGLKKRERDLRKRETYLHSLLTHDLRNKAQVVKGYLGLLDSQDEKEKQKIEKAEKALEETLSMVDRVKSFVKSLEQDKKKSIHISEFQKLIKNALDQKNELIQEKNVEIEVEDKCENDFTIKAGEFLRDVFANLIENSIFHGNCNKIKITCEEKSDSIVLSVSDDGVGVDEEEKQLIFDIGYTSKMSSGGFGLYFSKKIIEEFGGNIEVKESEELGGTRFDIFLQKT